ncbi:MAG: DUF349 domain-containing protein [Flavobacteriales bacterium]|nr:DUF349 domain-containing protein [Flavobacteriales bacterium]
MDTEETKRTEPIVDKENIEIEKTDESLKSDEIADAIDFTKLDTESLISKLQSLLDSAPIQSMKAYIDEAKKIFYDRSNEAYKKALEAFKAEHNLSEADEPENFDFIYPQTEDFKKVLKNYKTLRDAYYGDLDKQMKSNLKVKLELIEELKGLINADEKIKETFEHFKNIQEKWKSAGQVPKSELDNLWKTYHHHVENFFDYLRINNDLRDIEFKRNLEKKTSLCEKAETIVDEDNLDLSFEILQELHEQWKEIGPVGKIDREPIWKRFQEATKLIHKKRNDYYEKRKESFEENFQAKLALCETVENVDYTLLTHHNKWQKQSESIKQLREDWKKIGPISREQNDKSWTRFISAIKLFNSKKNDFYKQLKQNQKDNLAVKLEIVEKAESLAKSTDWKETSNTLKRLQSDWKKSGMASKKESDALWKRLKTACNTFFDNLKKQQSIEDEKLASHLEAKQSFLKQVEAFKNTGDTKKDIETIKGFISSWKELGKVPRKNIKSIEGSFRKLIDSFFEQLDIDKAEKRDIQFKSKIESIVAEDDQSKLSEELYKLQQESKKCKEELTLLETNIGFFKHAKDDNPLLLDVKKNIEKQKEKLLTIKSRMAFVKSF